MFSVDFEVSNDSKEVSSGLDVDSVTDLISMVWFRFWFWSCVFFRLHLFVQSELYSTVFLFSLFFYPY